MASIINFSIDLTKIPKDKIIDGKKGKYLPVTLTLNDETKEEREAKTAKVYLGNAKVNWTNGQNVNVAPRDGQPQRQAAPAPQAVEDDLPF